MCSRQRTCQKKGSTWQTVWNTNFTWKGSSQFPEFSRLFWHGICSALEYGQEIAREVVSLKWRVRSHLVRWEMEKCTPLWREARFQVKMYKVPEVRSTFGRWHVEKVHAVVARSRFRNQNVQSSLCSDHFWKLRCRKSAHVVVAWSTFGSWDVEKVHAVVARSTFRSENAKTATCSRHFCMLKRRFVWQVHGISRNSASGQTWENIRVL